MTVNSIYVYVHIMLYCFSLMLHNLSPLNHMADNWDILLFGGSRFAWAVKNMHPSFLQGEEFSVKCLDDITKKLLTILYMYVGWKYVFSLITMILLPLWKYDWHNTAKIWTERFYTEIKQASPKPWNKIEMIEILCSVILIDMIKLTMRKNQ